MIDPHTNLWSAWDGFRDRRSRGQCEWKGVEWHNHDALGGLCPGDRPAQRPLDDRRGEVENPGDVARAPPGTANLLQSAGRLDGQLDLDRDRALALSRRRPEHEVGPVKLRATPARVAQDRAGHGSAVSALLPAQFALPGDRLLGIA